MNTPGQHRTRETNLLTVVLALPCAAAVAGSMVPGLDDLLTRALLALVVAGVLGVTARYGLRWFRERREDRADLVTAAAWRAAHPQHTDHRQPSRPPAGVA